MIPFKDISYAQGAWNMDTDSDPIVAMKASGVYTSSKVPYLDVQLVRNYADAIRLGKVPILYHFAGGGDPIMEANYFNAAVSPYAAGDVYALDWEIEHPDPVGWVNAFLDHFHALTGAWPLVYMDIDRLNRFDWSSVFAKCPLWCAAPSYGWNDTLPVKYVVSAQQGPIVNGVDTDMWFGTIEGLKACGYQGNHASAPTPPTPAPSPAATPPPVPAPDPTPTPPTPPENPPSPVPETPPVVTPTPPAEPPVVVLPTSPVAKPPTVSLPWWKKVLLWIRTLFKTK